jgi:glycosyltransferase involved in cell wall biosynthesis
MRLVTIFEAPAPYSTAWMNVLAQDVDLHGIYLAAEDRVSRFDDSFGATPKFDYSLHWTTNLDIPSVDWHLELTAGVTRRLSRLKPDVILLGGWKPAVLEPLLWSRWSGSAAVMWAESTLFSGLLRGALSTRIRRTLARMCDAYVTNGSQATRYVLELGAPADRVVTSALPAATAPRSSKRAIPQNGAIRYLFVGRLLAQKRPLELIAAFHDVRKALPGATLTIVGAGELEREVRAASDRADGIHYVGRLEGDTLAALYAQSDVLVLPALREVWGLVVNEALAHGLFVVATDQVGSAYDLLDAESGLMLPAEDPDRLAPALIEAGRKLDLSDAGRRRRAAATAHCTPEQFAADIHRAAEVALSVRATRWRRPRAH